MNGYKNAETFHCILQLKNRSQFLPYRNMTADNIKSIFHYCQETAIEDSTKVSADMVSVLLEIGSLGQVDWDEVAEAVKTEKK